MKKKFISIFLVIIIVCAMVSNMCLPATASNESKEMFVEHNASTNSDTYFSLDDIATDRSTLSKVQSVSLSNGVSYTLPYNPSSGYSSVTYPFEHQRSILPGVPSSPVSNVNVSPFCKTVLIVMKFQRENGSFIYTSGSGAMVGNKVLLTAGHVIYHTTEHLDPYEIRVFLRVNESKNSESDMFYSTDYYHAQSWVFSANFKPSGNRDYDWCYLTMFDDIGKTYTGWYGIGTNPGTITDYAVHVNGYPDVSSKRYHQYTSSGLLSSISEYRISHSCSTEGGQSGAPLYSNSYVVWGVHTHGTSASITYNSGTRITSTLYTLLTNKINETNGD